MKTILLRSLLPVAFLALTLSSFGQAYLSDPKFGANEEERKECATNLSLYQEFYNQKNYNQAKSHWIQVLKLCPASRQNTYVHGVRMVKTWIEEERNPNRKKILLDSLMLLYDMRIEHFGNRGTLLGQKGIDLIQLDPDRFEEAYSYLKESVELEKVNSTSVVLFTYMNITKTMYDNKKLGAEAVIETYALLADYLDAQIQAKPDDQRTQQVKESIDAIFSSAGVADCDNLNALFGPRISANPSDMELVKKTFSLLSANRCESTEFYRNLNEMLFNDNPTSTRAYELAKIYVNMRDFKKAESFYNEAIKLEADSIRKSVYLFEYANIMNNEFRNPQQARVLALQAISENPNLGHAYMLIGNLYASEKNCGADDFEKKAVYWAAVDKFIRAKQVDPSLASDCDKLIDLYVQYFPAQQDIFFQDYTPGDRFTIKCWINETTTIRARP